MKKDNSGALFKNNRKETDTHPDYNGKCQINGVEYYMNAWLNTSKQGKQYLSFSFKEIVNHSDMARQAINSQPVMSNQSNNYSQTQQQQSYNDNQDSGFEDDIPF